MHFGIAAGGGSGGSTSVFSQAENRRSAPCMSSPRLQMLSMLLKRSSKIRWWIELKMYHRFKTDWLMKMSVLVLSWLCGHELQGICQAAIHFAWHTPRSAHWYLQKRAEASSVWTVRSQVIFVNIVPSSVPTQQLADWIPGATACIQMIHQPVSQRTVSRI